MNPEISLIQKAIHARLRNGMPAAFSALRLFNGFLEGFPDLQIDLFADTILFSNHAKDPSNLDELLSQLQTIIKGIFPEIQCILLKERYASQKDCRNGKILFGSSPADRIEENNVKYKLDLTLNLDASFYLDTRNLRIWLTGHANKWNVLNTFAYTGSLGIACLAGGASLVTQTDRTRRFLDLAKNSCELNNLPKENHRIQPGDFFFLTSQYRRLKEEFACVILDPPFFSTSIRGTVNLQTHYQRIVNKVRPLVCDDGCLIVINNSLFQSGKEFIRMLEEIGSEGFVKLEEIIPVPEDVTGYPDTIKGLAPADPAPFNHSTKIAILRIRRK